MMPIRTCSISLDSSATLRIRENAPLYQVRQQGQNGDVGSIGGAAVRRASGPPNPPGPAGGGAGDQPSEIGITT
jgi:hypothetical protein